MDGLTSFPDMLNHVRQQLPSLVYLLTGGMYLTGMIFAFRGVYALKVYGELRTMMASQASLKEPMLYFFIAGILIFYPSSINMSLNTVFGTSNVLAYSVNPNAGSQANQVFEDAGYVLRIIGYISFFRGWLILSHLGGQGSPPGTLAKALNHIIGGVFLVNVFETWAVVKSFLGIN